MRTKARDVLEQSGIAPQHRATFTGCENLDWMEAEDGEVTKHTCPHRIALGIQCADGMRCIFNDLEPIFTG